MAFASIRSSNRDCCYNRHEYGSSVKNRRFIPISNSRKRLIGRSCTATIAKPVETLVNQAVLALLRKLEFKVLNFQSLFVLPVVVQSVDDTLSVVLTGAKNIALILLSLESSRREALRNRKAKVTLTIAEFGSVFTILEEQVTAEISNLALSLATAVLQSLDNIAVTEVNSIDNTLSREANLTSNLLDSSLNIAAALLKSVEVNVKRLS